MITSAVTIVKSQGKKFKIIFLWLWSLRYSKMSPKSEFWKGKWWILRLTQEKMMGFDYCEEYLRSASNKMLLRQCLKKQMLIQLSFADWQKINKVNKKRSKRKNWFKLYLWGFSKKKFYVVHISLYCTRDWNR